MDDNVVSWAANIIPTQKSSNSSSLLLSSVCLSQQKLVRTCPEPEHEIFNFQLSSDKSYGNLTARPDPGAKRKQNRLEHWKHPMPILLKDQIQTDASVSLICVPPFTPLSNQPSTHHPHQTRFHQVTTLCPTWY